MSDTNTQPPKRAISYVRFSTMRQELGNTDDRQHELAVKYCNEHNLKLDAKIYRDAGVSGFRGDNRKKGDLSGLLEAAKHGIIPEDTYLLVESLDRLSRERIEDQARLLMDIRDLGINVVTLSDQQVFLRKGHPDRDESQDFTQMMISVSVMFRGRNESSEKQRRVLNAKKQLFLDAKKHGYLIDSKMPLWLESDESIKGVNQLTKDVIRVIDDRKKVILQIIDLYLTENLSFTKIANKMNADGVVCWENREVKKGNKKKKPCVWTLGKIANILSQPALYGCYHSEKFDESIEDYYPAIITKDKFLQIRGVRASRANKQLYAGRGDKEFSNIFKGCVNCDCGGQYVFERRGAKPSGVRYTYLSCKTCKNRISYNTFEEFALNAIRSAIDWGMVIHGKSRAAAKIKADNDVIRGQIAEKKTSVKQLKERWKVSKSNLILELIEEVEAELNYLIGQLKPENISAKIDPKDGKLFDLGVGLDASVRQRLHKAIVNVIDDEKKITLNTFGGYRDFAFRIDFDPDISIDDQNCLIPTGGKKELINQDDYTIVRIDDVDYFQVPNPDFEPLVVMCAANRVGSNKYIMSDWSGVVTDNRCYKGLSTNITKFHLLHQERLESISEDERGGIAELSNDPNDVDL